jgi:NADP-dependent aldehyde dehydrogenase
MYQDATQDQIQEALEQSYLAFKSFSKLPLKSRASLMKAIALEIEKLGDELIQTTMQETHLPEARLKGERARTIYQLNSYADACVKGDWLEARITSALPDRTPPRPDIRKMLVPIGPVVVFGSSNFPYAYSTAGGDTASALAAGCTVVVKAHPAHPQTSSMVASAIQKAIQSEGLNPNIFIHLYGASHEVGQALVMHSRTKAVGFTGSYQGGMALFNWANQRKEPIPVFAEMGSVNPVYLFPDKLKSNPSGIAQMYADSITLGVGQFCTNPGIIIGIESVYLDSFTEQLAEKIQSIKLGNMLHEGIEKSYQAKSTDMLLQPSVQSLTPNNDGENGVHAVIAKTSAQAFLKNPVLHQEVFGPFSLVVTCADSKEMKAVASSIEGQLTTSLLATPEELELHTELVDEIKEKCGRLILNGVPTGVEVCHAMHHGGPFPATTDSRFTSVGPDAIKRFARPMAFQNFPDEFLPDELKLENPLLIHRIVE